VLAGASAGWMIYLGIAIGSLSGLAYPAMQSLMTDAVPENAQGELQGAIASTISLTAIAGPIVMSGVFEHFADETGSYFPGAPFILATGLLTLAILLYRITIGRVPARET
jgi:MFS transporter, DHA1 family, tetracycline resistance protein